jgi:hypothetical protein
MGRIDKRTSGQKNSQLRKENRKREKQAQLEAEASRLGISISELRRRKAEQVEHLTHARGKTIVPGNLPEEMYRQVRYW